MFNSIFQEYCMTEFLRMSGVYWGVTALDIMGQVSKIDRASIIEFIKKCQNPISGGISPCEGHDPHILYTLSAVQVKKNEPNDFSNGTTDFKVYFFSIADFVYLRCTKGNRFGIGGEICVGLTATRWQFLRR